MTWTDGVPAPAVDLPSPCVVLCPPLGPNADTPDWFGTCRVALTAHGIPFVAPLAPPRGSRPADLDPAGERWRAQAHWVASIAAVIDASAGGHPLVVVAAGETVQGLPALALSQRAARHSVVGYVVVDADLTMPADAPGEWPAAPVTYVRTSGSKERGWRIAGLRDWRRLDTEPVAAILAAVARASGAGPDLG